MEALYKNIFKKSLNRLLNLYNDDKLSTTYGIGDRWYWGWKCSDFVNATYQGGVHSLAIAIKLEMLDKQVGLRYIDAIINAIPKFRHKNGAIEEAYPFEQSFCVTALVCFDCFKCHKVVR